MSATAWLAILAAVAGLVSSVLMYFGGIGVPHDKISWDGRSDIEVAHRKKQWWFQFWGFFTAAIAFVAAVLAAVVAG